jgi:hypothetical protein
VVNFSDELRLEAAGAAEAIRATETIEAAEALEAVEATEADKTLAATKASTAAEKLGRNGVVRPRIVGRHDLAGLELVDIQFVNGLLEVVHGIPSPPETSSLTNNTDRRSLPYCRCCSDTAGV